MIDSALEYYELTFWISLYGPFFEVYFVWYEYYYPSFSFLSISLEDFFPTLHFQSVYGFCSQVSLFGSIYVWHVFLSTQLLYVFWLEYLMHAHLRLLIGCSFFPHCTCVPLSFTPFLSLLLVVPLVNIVGLLWWRCILSAISCLGSPYRASHFNWEPH